MAEFSLNSREATFDDLATIVEMLANDPLGSKRVEFF